MRIQVERGRRVFWVGLLLVLVACGTAPAAEETVTPAAAPTLTVAPAGTWPAVSVLPTPTAPLPAVTEPLEEPGGAEEPGIVYTVQPGDTLLGLARQYGVPMAALQLQNGLGESTVVRVGESLEIPSPVAWEGASAFWVLHQVSAGETLLGIARAYGLNVADLQAVNGLNDANAITVGQLLVLPLDSPAVARAPAPTATPVRLPTPTSPPPTESPSPTASPAPESPPPALPPADVAAWPREIARLINEERAAHGLPLLVYNELLEQAAQAHANDCLQRGWCSHVGSDGSNSKTRIIRAGYDPAGWAECWAHCQTPQWAIDIWMDEAPPDDPHRRTLLSDWLTEVGVGVVRVDWGVYFIADFGRPAN